VSFGEVEAQDSDVTGVELDDFENGPIVVTQVGGADDDAVTTRVSDVTSEGFNVRLQEDEAADGEHDVETIYWMAVEEGEGELSAFEFAGVDHTLTDLGTGMPTHLLAAMQTFDGTDTAVLRYAETDGGSLAIRVQEEKSADAEIGHLPEIIGAIHTEASYISLDVA